MQRVLHWLFSGLVSVLMLACTPPKFPGESLGGFRMQADLQTNTCAPGFNPSSSYVFTPELRRDSTVLYWIWNGQNYQGRVSESGQINVEINVSQQLWAADPAQNIRGCTLLRKETISGVLTPLNFPDASNPNDAGSETGISDPTDASDAASSDAGDSSVIAPGKRRFEGTYKVEYSPFANSDCTPVLQSSGGGFPTLPCAANYVMVGGS